MITGFDQVIEMGRLDLGIPQGADSVPPLIIGEQEEEVGAGGEGGGRGGGRSQ